MKKTAVEKGLFRSWGGGTKAHRTTFEFGGHANLGDVPLSWLRRGGAELLGTFHEFFSDARILIKNDKLFGNNLIFESRNICQTQFSANKQLNNFPSNSAPAESQGHPLSLQTAM